MEKRVSVAVADKFPYRMISYPRSGRHFVQNVFKSLEIRLFSTHSIDNFLQHKNAKPIVLIRHPLYTIVSNWEYHSYNKHKQPYKAGREKEFHNFLNREINLWIDYHNRVLGLFKLSEYSRIKYHDITYKPVETFVKLFNRLDERIDENFLCFTLEKMKGIQQHGNMIKHVGVEHRQRSLSERPFYNSDVFAGLLDIADNWMKEKGVALIGV